MRDIISTAATAGNAAPGAIRIGEHEAVLDIVVPFTTPELTRAALRMADQLGTGLNASVRLLRAVVVPYPLELDQPDVYPAFLRQQLETLASALPMRFEILMTRDLETALHETLHPQSLVVMAYQKRPWKTRNERLGARLKARGHRVVLVSQWEKHHA